MTKVNNLSSPQQNLYDALKEAYPDTAVLSRAQIKSVAERRNIPEHHVTSLVGKFEKVSRGVYNMTVPAVQSNANAAPNIHFDDDVELAAGIYVPRKMSTYVEWGHANDVARIIASGHFFPVFITGLSGNGKTMMVEQACAKVGREFIRVQINPETDEDDLIGGFRLLNGETVFDKGPVIRAMEAGAILLIDEIDRGSNKLMCIQGVLEGKPVLIKKTGEVVRPRPGFNVIATANTKGQGSDDGRFAAATVIDDAFLERFAITMEQPYPSSTTEKKIMRAHMKHHDIEDPVFIDMLAVWAHSIRKTFADGGVDETISTRRLCHIIQTYSIFGDRTKAVKLCVARFDDDTKNAFYDLYIKLDAEKTKEHERDFAAANNIDSTEPLAESVDHVS